MKISLFSRSRGDQLSFEELLAPHIEPLYRLAYRFSGSQHDAEDLVQELLTKLYPRFKELRAVDHLRPWLARAMHHLYIDSYRKAQRSPVDYVESEKLDCADSPQPGPEQMLVFSQLQQDIIGALSQLNEDQRMLIILHDIEAYTLEELSEILDAPLGTLKSRLHRSRARLKKILNEGTFSAAAAC